MIQALEELLKANKELSDACNPLGEEEVDYAVSVMNFAITDLFDTIGLNREAMERGNY